MKEKQFLDLGGKDFILDLEKITDIVRLPALKQKNEKGELVDDEEAGPHIDVTKYEMIREMVGAILTSADTFDDKMGMVGLNSSSVPFKISFNTLLHYDILAEIE